jgi:hypothetical protein
MRSLNVRDANGCISEASEFEHHDDPRFDAAMILLELVVQALRCAHPRVSGGRRDGLHLTHRTVRRRVAVQHDRRWSVPPSSDCVCEERFCGHIFPSCQPRGKDRPVCRESSGRSRRHAAPSRSQDAVATRCIASGTCCTGISSRSRVFSTCRCSPNSSGAFQTLRGSFKKT